MHKWSEAQGQNVRPFERSQEELPTVPLPYRFAANALDDALIYSNGECLALIYSRSIVANAFPGTTSGVFQVFNVDSGLLVQESEYTFAMDAKAAAFDPEKNRLFMVHNDKGMIFAHRMRPLVTAKVCISLYRFFFHTMCVCSHNGVLRGPRKVVVRSSLTIFRPRAPCKSSTRCPKAMILQQLAMRRRTRSSSKTAMAWM